MGIENIVQRAMLISKSTGQKYGVGLTKDVFRFLNKRGESCTFTVLKDEFQKPVRKVLLNNKTGELKERNLFYKEYTYQNGEKVPYKEIVTRQYGPPSVPLENANLSLMERDVIATVSNGKKPDVTKSSFSFMESKENKNIFENTSVARFANGRKPYGFVCNIERTPAMEIIWKETMVQKPDGKVAKIISDFFYNSAAYPDVMYKKNIISLLKSEMGLKDYGVTVKLVHYGHNPSGFNNLAEYRHRTKTVSLNVDVPWVNTRKGFASELSHELLHAWQHREVELLEQGLLKGARKEAAQVYKNEFNNYITSSATDKAKTAAYKAQEVERKSCELQKFVEQYYNQNMKNIYNKYVKGIIPPQIGITSPLPSGTLKDIP